MATVRRVALSFGMPRLAHPSPAPLRAAVTEPATGLGRYWAASRSHRYSLLFALPLLLVYEALASLLPRAATGGVRNGADVLLTHAFVTVAGRYGPLLFMIVLGVVGAWLIAKDLRAHRGELRGAVFAGMLLESSALALVFGFAVGLVTAQLLGVLPVLALARITELTWLQQLTVSLGAGLYEELLFRVLLVSALAALARLVLGWRPRAAGIFATLVGALVFSAFHYVGSYGDTLELQSFVFRAVGGVFFSALFLMRGFGIVAWTHALYDVFLLLLKGA